MIFNEYDCSLGIALISLLMCGFTQSTSQWVPFGFQEMAVQPTYLLLNADADSFVIELSVTDERWKNWAIYALWPECSFIHWNPTTKNRHGQDGLLN
jgi:hypothetical protein